MELLERRVTGYKKIQRGQPCEDAVCTRTVEDVCLLACADGHGDPRCRYAARGAELAARIAVNLLSEMRRECADLGEYGERLNDEREAMAKALVCRWVEAVLEDYLLTHPEDTAFAARHDELAAYSTRIYEVRDGRVTPREFRRMAELRHAAEEEIYRITALYGTTLNLAAVSKKFVFAMGIGDGDVVAVNGGRVEWLLPYAPRFSETSDSLSGSFGRMLEQFSAVFVPVTAGRGLTESRFRPELVMIATDGLRNAFLSDEEWAEKLLDIGNALKRGRGHEFARKSRGWLEERTRFGVTQDDIAFCLCTDHSLKRRKGGKG